MDFIQRLRHFMTIARRPTASRPLRMSVILVTALGILGGCATRPVNPSIVRV